MKNKQTILILGATGMFGHSLYQSLANDNNLKVYGTVRNKSTKTFFPKENRANLIANIDVLNTHSVATLLKKIKPNLIINAVGVIKQLDAANDPLQILPLNSVFPHQLAKLTKDINARLILMSTDCVFSGNKGNYSESDPSDCTDLYGRSKLLGEIADQSHVLTIRTSVIGHELRGGQGLLSWFLAQKDSATGFSNVIFSGLPSIELASIIRNYILPDASLHGLYQISAKPISKYDLLKLIAKVYRKNINIKKSNSPKINRSLISTRFKKKTGYKPKSWEQLIYEMHQDYLIGKERA